MKTAKEKRSSHDDDVDDDDVIQHQHAHRRTIIIIRRRNIPFAFRLHAIPLNRQYLVVISIIYIILSPKTKRHRDTHFTLHVLVFDFHWIEKKKKRVGIRFFYDSFGIERGREKPYNYHKTQWNSNCI